MSFFGCRLSARGAFDNISVGGLGLSRFAKRAALNRLRARAEAARDKCASLTDGVEYLLNNIGILCVYAHGASAQLKSSGRVSARVGAWARALVGNGDARFTLDDITSSLRALDEEKMLCAWEIWNAPDILRVCAADAFARVAGEALDTQSEWLRAEKWISSPSPLPSDVADPSFFVYALKLASDAEDADKRAQLLRRLALTDRTEEDCVRLSRDKQSLQKMRLENLLNLGRTLDEADWEKLFAAVSLTEQALMDDPSGVYAHMDEASRAAVRQEAASIARQTGFPERSVAKIALEAARESETEAGVCAYLYTDEGREALNARMEQSSSRLRAMTPDPDGHKLLFGFAIIFALICALGYAVSASVYVVILSAPVAWSLSAHILRRLASLIAAPKPLLRLKTERVPDDSRTLIVMPALITSPARGEALIDQLAALGALDDDENIHYLLLGDFQDSESERAAGDEHILRAVNARVSELNARARREKFYYLHRLRAYNSNDSIWMGRERKRGALNALNTLLVAGENQFHAEGRSADALKGRYKYVITLDADTRMLPGTAQKLIGVMRHPLNAPRVVDGRARGYAVVQPRMELDAERVTNRFQRTFAGGGGMDNYFTCVSDLYMDICAHGVFGGKGIYDVRAFYDATIDAFPDNAILSHDLIEGVRAGAGAANDIMLYEGFPVSAASYLKRLERWTRGDWQLMPYLFGRLKLRAIDRFKILDNIVRSLLYPSISALFIHAAWFQNTASVLFALVGLITPVVFMRFRGWTQALSRFLLLPGLTHACASGLARAVWRMCVTHKYMLKWITAADADAQALGKNTVGYAYSILLLPVIARPLWIPYGALLALAFSLGRLALDSMSARVDESEFTSAQFGLLMALARDTWRYFDKFVPEDGNGLPPDNVQLDPKLGAAMRTSPTNVGMYLCSVIAAREMALISTGEMRARLNSTICALEKLDKWRGLMYNWYDIVTLTPLRPRYVSSVDCGNLLASIILTANAVASDDEALCARLRALADNMDFSGLFDDKRKLFVIGYDAERERLSGSHYDLLASESRILSFVTIAEKRVPVEHWTRLGRPCVRVKGGCSLVSWSGTMFEYLMPFLFMPSRPHTLLGLSARGAIGAQMRYARLKDRPWGVSECAYRAFDASLNYQYRAFGVPELAISGEVAGDTVAPYASALALCACPREAADNIFRLKREGMWGEYGLYEAADYSDPGMRETVFSYMSHHQGMILLAVCNALSGGRMRDYFMHGDNEKALTLLLNEKPFARPRVRGARGDTFMPAPVKGDESVARRMAQGTSRGVKSTDSHEGHLLFGAGATAYIMPGGQGFYRRAGVYANMWRGAPERDRQSLLPEIREDAGIVILNKAAFDIGGACFSGASENAAYEIEMCISPETGALLIAVRAHANAGVPVRAIIRHAFSVALCDEEQIHAHPAFANLFVMRERCAQDAWRFTRRKREPRDADMALTHALSGAARAHDESPKAYGRGERAECAGEGEAPLRLDSCLSAEINIQAGARQSAYFSMALTSGADDMALKRLDEMAFQRALSLGRTQSRTALNFSSLSGAAYRLLDRASARFVVAKGVSVRAPEAVSRASALWAFGISGDRPLMCVMVDKLSKLETVRRMIRAHEFYRVAGLYTDLIIVNEYGNEYAQPLRDAVEAMLASSHLSASRGVRGGAYLLDGNTLSPDARALIVALAAIYAGGNIDFMAALRGKDDGAPVKIKRVPIARDMSLDNVDGDIGHLSDDGREYVINILPGRDTPAPWVNVIAQPRFGALVSERGGGFTWFFNSRSGRLTPFDNDPALEGWGERVYAIDDDVCVPLTPMERARGAYRVTHGAGYTRFECARGDIAYTLTQFVDMRETVKYLCVQIRNLGVDARAVRVIVYVDWLMGVDARDKRLMRCWLSSDGAFARGKMEGVAFLAPAGGERVNFVGRETTLPEGLDDMWALPGRALGASVIVEGGALGECAFALGWAEDDMRAKEILARINPRAALGEAREYWDEKLDRLRVDTLCAPRDALINRFFKYQALACRVFARTGLYQPGGAYGFRDQLQDMLCVMYMDASIARAHILECAARQFEDGDVMHWWHAPRSGVRTRTTDDMLFLPYVCARYVSMTGDTDILSERAPYLVNETIPEGQADWYGEARVSDRVDTVYAHCMAAFERAWRIGAHDLLLMGAGDWNDGMNRVGAKGVGESVWLTEFYAAAAEAFAGIIDGNDADTLRARAERARAAVEANAWDGEWYLRAYDDEGNKIGSRESAECQIDLISQAWAALNSQDPARVDIALNSVDARLVDKDARLIRLLAPPFTSISPDPGYIAAYPSGVRENGGQYTHAACWLVAAYARAGDAKRAWEALDMLIPIMRASSREGVYRYRAEPYVQAADICAEAPRKGVAGWTWYTGAASWTVRAAIEYLLGFTVRAGRAQMRALLINDMPDARVIWREGNSEYTFISARAQTRVTLDGAPIDTDDILLIDDGKPHEARFPAREA